MATYTEIDITIPNDSTSMEYKAKQAQFYLQGYPVYLVIPSPTDKTVKADYNFSYTCDIEYSPISAIKDSNNVIHYRYNNSFKPKSTNIALTKATTTGYTDAYTTTIPKVDSDAAFRFTVYANDEISGKVSYSNTVIIYAFWYGTLTTQINSIGWDDGKINLNYQFTLTGPKLQSGIQTPNYHYWFNKGMLNGWSTYFSDIYISPTKINSLPVLPQDTPKPTIRLGIAVPETDLTNYYIYNKNTSNTTEDHTGDNLIFTPYGSSRDISDPYNVKLEFDENYSYFIVDIKGLQHYWDGNAYQTLDSTKIYYFYIQAYNNTNTTSASTFNKKSYLSTSNIKLIPPTPIMQMRKNTIAITRPKDCDEVGVLIVDNSSTDNLTVKDNIALYKTAFKANTGSANQIPSIGIFNSSGNRYFIIEVSTSEAEAWYNLINS